MTNSSIEEDVECRHTDFPVSVVLFSGKQVHVLIIKKNPETRLFWLLIQSTDTSIIDSQPCSLILVKIFKILKEIQYGFSDLNFSILKASIL